MDIVAKNTTPLHQHRHTGQQHSTAQQEKTPTQIRISDCQRTGRQKQQQQQIQKKRCQQPSQYTHPGIDPILLYRHFAKRENAAAIIGHQTDRLVCITHIQYNGIMRPPHCKKLTFARHYHCVICHKINAGMGFLLVFILRRYKIIVCFDFIVPRRQPQLGCTQNAFFLGWFYCTNAALLVIVDRCIFCYDFPLIRHDLIVRCWLHSLCKRKSNNGKLNRQQNHGCF